MLNRSLCGLLGDSALVRAGPGLSLPASSLSCVLRFITQSYPTLCDPMDRSRPGASLHGDSPGENTGVGCHALLQGIFLTQELNWGLLPCRRILYQLSYLSVAPRWCLTIFSFPNTAPSLGTWSFHDLAQFKILWELGSFSYRQGESKININYNADAIFF